MKDERVTIYTSEPNTFSTFLKEIWAYRILILTFAKRDLKVKYSQTILGLGWTLFQPLTAWLIYVFFFGYLLKLETNGIPFPIYVMSGLIGWSFFSQIVSSGGTSLIEAGHLVKKVYFPKSVIPLYKVVYFLLDLSVNFLLLLLLLIIYKQMVSWKIIFLPLVLIFNIFCALLLVFWITYFSYKMRDLVHLIPFVLNFGIWLSPVFITENLYPTPFNYLIDLNPMSSVVQLWRWSLFDYGVFKWIWVFNFLVVSILLLLGMYFFNKKEGEFVDRL